MNSFRSNVRFHIDMSETGGSPVFGQSQHWSASFDLAVSLLNGVAAGQADIGYIAERSIADGANDDIDLAGVLTTALGQSITVAKIKALLLVNRPRDPADEANTTDLTLGGAANPWLGMFGGVAASRLGPIKPGGFLLIGAADLAGLGTVTAATADVLRVANTAGATANYVFALLAASA